MKSVIITLTWIDNPVSNYFRLIGEAYSELGYKVYFLCPPKFDSTIKTSHELIFWPSQRPTKLVDFVFYIRLLRRTKAELVISNFGATNITLLGGYLFGVNNRIVWYHTLVGQILSDTNQSTFRRNFNLIRKKIIYRLATKVIANSEASKIDFQEFFSKNIEIAVIHFFLDFDKNLIQSKINQNTLIMVARFNKSKGHDLVLKVFKKLTEEIDGLQLKLIGAGPLENVLKQKSIELGVFGYISWLGHVSLQEVYENISTSNVFISASSYEAFGLVNLEAKGLGTPVVGIKTGGIPDIIRHEIDGVLVQSSLNENLLIENMKNAILEILIDPVKRENYSLESRKDFESRFNYSKSLALNHANLILSQ